MPLFDRAIDVFAHARPDDAGGVVRILCIMAMAADRVGDRVSRDRTIGVVAHLAADPRLKRRSRPD